MRSRELRLSYCLVSIIMFTIITLITILDAGQTSSVDLALTTITLIMQAPTIIVMAFRKRHPIVVLGAPFYIDEALPK